MKYSTPLLAIGISVLSQVLSANAQAASPERLCLHSGAWVKDANIIENSSCTLKDARFRGNVMMINGTLTIESSIIDGDVNQVGNGDLIITDGDNQRASRISGNVNESGDGQLRIMGSFVEGNVAENGKGNVRLSRSTIGTFSRFANVAEADSGNLYVENGTWVHGNVAEDNSGSAFVQHDAVVGSHRFPGNVAESKSGNLYVQESGAVAGNVAEDDAGSLFMRTSAFIGGNAIQGGTGSCRTDPVSVRGNFVCR